MGLDCFIFEDKGEGIDPVEICYWRKNWFIHENLATYAKTEGFNCEDLYLNLEMLNQLKSEMIDECVNQINQLEEPAFRDRVSSDDIYVLNKAINYLIDNPEAKIYYYGWY